MFGKINPRKLNNKMLEGQRAGYWEVKRKWLGKCAGSAWQNRAGTNSDRSSQSVFWKVDGKGKGGRGNRSGS